MINKIAQDTRKIPSVLLWGGKSKARIINEMLNESSLGVTKIIFDSLLSEASFKTTALFINDIFKLKENLLSVSHYIVCIGGEHGYARVKIAAYLENLGLNPITLIHDKSFVEPTSKIGKACLIMPCAVIHKFSQIGNYTIVNTNATIDHECTIGDGVHIMGGAAIAGKVEIDDYATIGTNATILPFVKIGKGAFIGAGAVVTKNVEPYSVVTGVPAKHIRTNEITFSEDLLKKLTI